MILSGADIRRYIETGKLSIVPVTEEQFQQNGIDLILEYFPWHAWPLGRFERGGFYLVGTRETLQMPDDLMAFVELRSTWARAGLLIPPTIVDAGFQGNLTIEVFCAGPGVEAPLGQRFIHLVFAKMLTPGDPYRGKYHAQRKITGVIADAPPLR